MDIEHRDTLWHILCCTSGTGFHTRVDKVQQHTTDYLDKDNQLFPMSQNLKKVLGMMKVMKKLVKMLVI